MPMNRHQRRALAAGAAMPTDRSATILSAHDYLAACDDPTVSGCTLILPDGETLFLDANASRAMRNAKPPEGGAS